jgi:putative MATE family efflux protein
MKDLTRDSIARNVIVMAVPIAAGMVFQTLYLLIDLYFVAALGSSALAGVSAAATLLFIFMAVTQVLGVGAMALIAQAVGRKDQADANLAFNQSLLLAALCAASTLAFGYGAGSQYMAVIAAAPATHAAGVTFLYWCLPGFALQFALVTMASALRGTGVVKPVMAVQSLTVVVNGALAPVLIAGWGTGYPLGVAGAALSTTVAIAVGVVVLAAYLVKIEKYVSFRRELCWPRIPTLKRLLGIGLPAGGELLLTFVYLSVIYLVVADVGAAAQAGFGIGSRIMQSILLPAAAISFAIGPIAAQNFGAGQSARVRETFTKAVLLNSAVILPVVLFLQWRPEVLVAYFASEPDVLVVGAAFLRVMAWAFLAQGVILACSGIFQGLGDTRPALLSSCARVIAFVPLVFWAATQRSFVVESVLYLAAAAMWLQAFVSYVLLRAQLRRRLPAVQPVVAKALG